MLLTLAIIVGIIGLIALLLGARSVAVSRTAVRASLRPVPVVRFHRSVPSAGPQIFCNKGDRPFNAGKQRHCFEVRIYN